MLLDEAEQEDKVPAAELDTLLPKADVVVILLPLTPETHHIVDGRFLARMKTGALVINAGRCAVVIVSCHTEHMQLNGSVYPGNAPRCQSEASMQCAIGACPWGMCEWKCRGPQVDTDALVKALHEGHIRAALDVTDPEPLPPGHPLWQARTAEYP